MPAESSPLLDVPDLDERGVVDPSGVFARTDAPTAAVMCFFQESVVTVGARDESATHAQLGVYGGRPMYETVRDGVRVAVFFPGVGAPAAAAVMEEAIVMGCRDFIAVGGAGELLPGHALGRILVVESAVRDEGTSHHYLPGSLTVETDPHLTQLLARILDLRGAQTQIGRVWTTDAIFRETPTRVRRRVAQGCHMVEMEAAALSAVAQYRGVRFAQMLYAGDTLAGELWDHRDWTSQDELRLGLLDLAIDAAASINHPDLASPER